MNTSPPIRGGIVPTGQVDTAAQKAKWALEPLYERLLTRLNAADHNGVRLILDMRRDLLVHLKSFPMHIDDGRVSIVVGFITSKTTTNIYVIATVVNS